MKVAFRVDASTEIGTGHVIRCLTLADRLADDGVACHFVMRELPGNLIDMIKASRHDVIELAAPSAPIEGFPDRPTHARWLGVDWQTDAMEVEARLRGIGSVDWLVVDHYALDSAWEERLRNAARQIMVIDDLADRPHDCDLLLDQNLRDDPHRYANLIPTRCVGLFGPSYALLRPEFAARRRKVLRDNAAPVRKVLVYFGGADPHNLTTVALEALEAQRDAALSVDVVVGLISPHKDRVANWCAKREWVRLHVGGADMADLMAGADLALGAGGTTTWERCCLGLPTILITIADNQRPGAEALGKCGAVLYVGDLNSTSLADLSTGIAALIRNPWLREHMSRTAAALIDGNGLDRVAAQLVEPRLNLRKATDADCKRVWNWRNSPGTRRYFRNPAPIDLATHQRWFFEAIRCDDCDLLIAEDTGQPVGVVRFDYRGGIATISIYLVPGLEGRGYGTRILRMAVDWLRHFHPHIATIEAEVLNDNLASHRLFQSAGFTSWGTMYRYPLDGSSKSGTES